MSNEYCIIDDIDTDLPDKVYEYTERETKTGKMTRRNCMILVTIPLLLLSITCTLMTLFCRAGWVWVEDQEMCFMVTNRQHRIV